MIWTRIRRTRAQFDAITAVDSLAEAEALGAECRYPTWKLLRKRWILYGNVSYPDGAAIVIQG